MNQEETLDLLRGIIDENQQFTTWTVSTPHIVMMVNKAVEMEKKACADLVEQMGIDGYGTLAIAAAIRARGNT